MHDNDKTTDQPPSLSDVLRVLYKPNTVYEPNLKLKPILFDASNAGVKQLDVSVISIQSEAEKALNMINAVVLEKK